MDKREKDDKKYQETDQQLENQAEQARELAQKLELERKANQNLRKWAEKKLKEKLDDQA